MRSVVVAVAGLIGVQIALAHSLAAGQIARPGSAAPRKSAAPRAAAPSRLRCGDYLSFQVRLDREGFSPGTIDGQPGANLTRALKAFQAARQITASGEPDCDTWKGLGGDSEDSSTTTYIVTDADVKGPFAHIPPNIEQQTTLPAMSYESPIEEIAERFHTTAAMIRLLNGTKPIAAGRDLRVPAVRPFDAGARPAFDPAAGDLTIQVSRDESALRATHADGTLAFFAPVTTGSEHDPLPPGDWKVTGVSWRPVFHYNPELFWDAKPGDTKSTVKPGPNNPVGVVWIGLNLENYGLHGTPEPSSVGHVESHGCVRLTNWDAARVAGLVKPGTPVLFR